MHLTLLGSPSGILCSCPCGLGLSIVTLCGYLAYTQPNEIWRSSGQCFRSYELEKKTDFKVGVFFILFYFIFMKAKSNGNVRACLANMSNRLTHTSMVRPFYVRVSQCSLEIDESIDDRCRVGQCTHGIFVLRSQLTDRNTIADAPCIYQNTNAL